MSYDLGSAEGHIKMTYDGKGATQAKQDMDSLEAKAKKQEAALNNAANTMGKAGLVIAGGLALAVNSAANFEQRLSAIQAVSGATEADMGRISDKALQLGKDTAFSADESAQAIEELIKAGLSVEDVLNGAADATVNLAAAGEIALPEAATIASNAMNQFNLAAKDMPHVADLIAGAANASAIDVGDFGQSMQQAGATANLVGLSFDDLAVAIAIMGNAGIRGSDAGTSLKTMLSNLQPTTEKQIGLFEKLGLMTENGSNKFFDAQGNIRSMADIAGTLNGALKGMTDQQKAMALETIFGSDAIRAAAVITDEGAKGFNKMADAMGEVTAQEVAEKRLDNMKGKLEELKGSLETAGIVIGTVFLPAVTSIVEGLTSFLAIFLDLSPAIQKFVGFAAAATAGALLLAAGIIKMVLFVRNAIIAFQLLSAALAANPIILIIAAIVALGIALVIAYKKSETFRKIVHAALDVVMVAAKALWEVIKVVGSAVESAFKTIIDAAQTVYSWVKTYWPGILVLLTGPFGIAILLIIKFWDEIKAVFQVALKVIQTYISVWVAVFEKIWDLFGSTIFSIIKNYLDFIVSVFKIAFGVIWTVVKTILDTIIGVVKGAMQIIQGIIKTITAIFRGDWQEAWNGIKQIVTGVTNIIKSLIKGWMNILKAIFIAGWNLMKAVVKLAWDNIKAVIIGALNVIKSTVGTLTNAAVSVFKSIWSGVKSFIQTIWDGIKSTISTALGAIKSALGAAADPIGAFKSAWDGVKTAIDAVVDAVQWLIDHINDIPTPDIDLPSPGDLKPWEGAFPGVASGGIVTEPTMLLAGEGGEKEYIIPESKMEWFLGLDKQKGPQELHTNGSGGGRTTNININNPEPERGSDSLVLAANQLSAIGVI